MASSPNSADRKHTFARVKLNGPEFHIELWMKAFPGPSNSPAHYAHSLTIIGTQLAIAGGTDVGRWIRAFHNICASTPATWMRARSPLFHCMDYSPRRIAPFLKVPDDMTWSI